MFQKELENLGLDNKEVQVYLSLLEIGEASIAKISKKSGVKRTTVYNAIEALKEKGLVSSTVKRQSTLYIAEDPRKLEQELSEKMLSLKNILPELLSISNFIDKKPKIKFFEGFGGLKDVYMDTLNYPDRELLAWISEKYVESFDENFLYDYYVPERVKRKIWVRALAPDDPHISRFKEEDEKSLRRTRLIPTEKYPFSVEINLYGKNKIGIVSFEEKIGLIVESEKIYGTLKSIFEINWLWAEEKQKI
jgi:sugar-specific transcriptional regulator TrmB